MTDRPSLICAKTVIGFGAPNVCGTHGVHGAPLGDEEIQATARVSRLGARAVRDPGGRSTPAGTPGAAASAAEAEWREAFEAYRRAHPELARDFQRRMNAASCRSGCAGHAEA
ncbi:MAG: hypothetical protein U5L11_14960 [Arhodomonas sp.]|nr:hypothetical protein [Arhodomonas sp.]